VHWVSAQQNSLNSCSAFSTPRQGLADEKKVRLSYKTLTYFSYWTAGPRFTLANRATCQNVDDPMAEEQQRRCYVEKTVWKQILHTNHAPFRSLPHKFASEQWTWKTIRQAQTVMQWATK